MSAGFNGRVEAIMTVPSGQTITATNSGGGPTAVTLTAGSYTTTGFCSMLQTQLNATRTPANWTVSVSTGSSGVTGTGLVTINWTGTGTYSVTFTGGSTTARTILGFTADISGVAAGTASVGTKQAIGVWIPNVAMLTDIDRGMAPMQTDLRQVQSPSGQVTSIVGTTYYRHTGMVWSHVPLSQIRETQTVYSNASLEFWLKETQFGQSTTGWYSAGSPIQAWDDSGTQVGADLNSGSGPSAGWTILNVPSIATPVLTKAIPGFNGLWRVVFGELVSSG
jgi:hypothetical protein